MKKKLYTKKPSGIHRSGLFAACDILEGTRVIEYVGKKITNKEADDVYDRDFEKSKNHTEGGAVYIFELNKRYSIDGGVRHNIARFINHSCDPNCEVEIIKGRIWIASISDIKKGKELFYDYGYDLEHWADHPCWCGAKGCIGYIVAEDQRKKFKKLLLKRKTKAKTKAKKKSKPKKKVKKNKKK